MSKFCSSFLNFLFVIRIVPSEAGARNEEMPSYSERFCFAFMGNKLILFPISPVSLVA